VVSRAAIAEEAIEKIVSGKLQYDAEDKTIHLTLAGASLPAKKKLLIYMVGLQGWPYVSDDQIPTDASPGELEQQLGLPGGTIRPMLIDLRDRHLLSSKNGRYSLRAGNLHAITSELEHGEVRARAKPRSSPSKNSGAATSNRRAGARRGNATKTGGQAALFG